MVEFEDLFKRIMVDVRDKQARGQSITEDLIAGFEKLYATIDNILIRAGRKSVIASNYSSSSLESENL
jgi:hypothetical protein